MEKTDDAVLNRGSEALDIKEKKSSFSVSSITKTASSATTSSGGISLSTSSSSVQFSKISSTTNTSSLPNDASSESNKTTTTTAGSVITSSSSSGSYTIGDKKVISQAEIINTKKQFEEQEKTNETLGTDSPADRKVKKPPPYHVAATMSKQAASFNYDNNLQVFYLFKFCYKICRKKVILNSF